MLMTEQKHNRTIILRHNKSLLNRPLTSQS